MKTTSRKHSYHGSSSLHEPGKIPFVAGLWALSRRTLSRLCLLRYAMACQGLPNHAMTGACDWAVGLGGSTMPTTCSKYAYIYIYTYIYIYIVIVIVASQCP